MDFRKLREIQRIIELTKALKEFRKIAHIVDESRKRIELRKWYQAHGALISSLSPDEMEKCREQVDYDESEWNRIVEELKKDKT